MTTIKDVRWVKNMKGHYHLANQTKSLCRICANSQECRLVQPLNSKYPNAYECKSYRYIIGFSNNIIGQLSGIGEHQYANTFRLGMAWSKRVKQGDLLGLYCMKAEKTFATCTVSDVFTGRKKSMIERFAADNHNYRNLNRREAIKALSESLPKNYGKMIYDGTDNLTVIYFCNVQPVRYRRP